MRRQLFGVEGLACAGCARGLEGRLKALPGVKYAGVHYLTGSALIDWDDALMSVAALAEATERAGYRMAARHDPEEIALAMGREAQRLGIRLAVAVFAGMWSMVPALVIYFTDLHADIAWWLALVSGLFALPVVFWAGSGFLWMGWRSIRLRAPGMDLLICLGTLGAMIASGWALIHGRSEVWFDTATMLVTLLLFGRLVDVTTRRSAVEALQAMENAAPETAKLLVDGQWEERRCREIPAGSDVAVDAGSPISMDGLVISGESHINRAILTGETALIAIKPGMRVEAGALNLGQRMVIRCDRLYGDRDIDRMGGAIALEIARRGTQPTAADIWAARLSVTIPSLAMLTVLATFAGGFGAGNALLRGLTLLVAVCPCALSIALPLAQMRAAQAAATLGMRLRDPDAFTAMGKLRSIVFDKTGTLTTGQLSVHALRPAPGFGAARLLELAARAETGVNHPIARAIVAAHGSEVGEGGQRQARGVSSRGVDGRQIWVGTAGQDENDGCTWVSVRLEEQEAGRISLSDTPAEGAAELLDELRLNGIEIRIATGDTTSAALAMARRLGVNPEAVFAACTPLEKAELLARLPRPVAFVGDGVNDGPALAAADCGISVEGAHSAAALTAPLVVTSGGISRVADAIKLSRFTTRIARQNFGLALIYNAVMLPAAVFGLVGPGLAAAAMLGSSLSVVLNSQRLTVPTQRRRSTEP